MRTAQIVPALLGNWRYGHSKTCATPYKGPPMQRTSVVAGLIAAAVALLAMREAALSQAYPNKSVRLLFAFPAGGSIDTLGRILAQKLSEEWGQNVVVENRPGAGGNLGAAAAAQATPDGYTLHLGAQTL